MAEETGYPSFEDFVKRGRSLERKSMTPERKAVSYSFDEGDVVEYKTGGGKTYTDLLNEVGRLRKLVAATYYSERLSAGKEAPLPPSFIEEKKAKKAKKVEKKKKVEKAKEEKAEEVKVGKKIKMPKAEEKKEVDFDVVLEEIGSIDDSLLAEYAKKNAPDLYENFNLGGMTAAGFRKKVRMLMAKKAGVPRKKMDEWLER